MEKQRCIYCKRLFPSNEDRCPYCKRIVRDFEPESSGLDGCKGVLTAMAICLLVIAGIIYLIV
jgi:hypothetical protein